MESGTWSTESQSGLHVLWSGERALDPAPSATPCAPSICFAVADHRPGALEVRARGELVRFVVRPRGCVREVDRDGFVLDDGGQQIPVRWTLPRGVRLPSLVGRRVRVEHLVEMRGSTPVSESLLVLDELGGHVLLAAHEGPVDSAPARFGVELLGRELRATCPSNRCTHALECFGDPTRKHVVFVATPRLL